MSEIDWNVCCLTSVSSVVDPKVQDVCRFLTEHFCVRGNTHTHFLPTVKGRGDLLTQTFSINPIPFYPIMQFCLNLGPPLPSERLTQQTPWNYRKLVTLEETILQINNEPFIVMPRMMKSKTDQRSMRNTKVKAVILLSSSPLLPSDLCGWLSVRLRGRST